ncbi:MAG: nicotinate-nicotinamide nucleotide adenylyltransferase [Bacteroidales bacterium]|nr:nicotinate-nicotinamide nucleotide adenylyltransferase [Bacteroidales bacterium]
MIAVYPGSFNPMHEGHLAIISYLEKHFDKVLVVVSPESPFKVGNYATGKERLAAVREKLKGRKAIVDDIEYHLEKPLYTVNTLAKIAEREADAPVLAIGGDSLADIKLWHDYKRLLLDYGLMVFPRQGFDIKTIKKDLLKENSNYKIKLLRTRLYNISSSQIRESLKK